MRKSDIDAWKQHWSADFRAANPGLEGQIPALGASCSRPEPKNDPIQPKSPLAAIFEEKWAELGGSPLLVPEYRFDPVRKWRFDYAIPQHKLAIELEGGIHARKGHASPEGYIKDCRKYNAAAAEGWLVFRLASGMMRDGDVAIVARAIDNLILERESLF
jgi:very-short-patch-repair endonuclease